MKLMTVQIKSEAVEQVVLLVEDRYMLPIEAVGVPYRTMNELILYHTEEDMEKLRCAAQDPKDYREDLIPREEVVELSPIPRPLQDILCLGLNYAEHAEEAAYYSKAFTNVEEPIFFSKRTGYSQGSHAPIPAHEEITQKLDFENELGVIIGKDARNVKAEDAADYIFGYTIVNDVSARDLQTRHKQWYFGKSLEGFSPMGPCITTADEIAFPPRLEISTTLNGEVRQNSNTEMLIHSIGEIIETLSAGMVLQAGSIIATGTPKGVLMGDEHPVFLKSGDEVICHIEKIGDLVNVVE